MTCVRLFFITTNICAQGEARSASSSSLVLIKSQHAYTIPHS